MNNFLTNCDPGDEQEEDPYFNMWLNKFLLDDDYWINMSKQFLEDDNDSPD